VICTEKNSKYNLSLPWFFFPEKSHRIRVTATHHSESITQSLKSNPMPEQHPNRTPAAMSNNSMLLLVGISNPGKYNNSFDFHYARKI
jgi:hypothetical protein